ncbi:MAG TPA: restriction endonuclease subunit S [Dialister sp.]|nr:restriction endonuclease subunit S [Dialister sp.]
MMEERKVPALRFQGFTDEWEENKLGEMTVFSKGSGYSKSDLQDHGTPIVLYGRLYTNYETLISHIDTFAEPKSGSVYSQGVEVIVPASGETAEDISRASVIGRKGVIIGGDLNILYPNKLLDPVFLAITISNGKAHDDMAKRAQGKTVVHLHNDDLAQIKLFYPSISEQKQIGVFFQKIDVDILLLKNKLDKLQVFKKSMLEKMFPRPCEKVPEVRFRGFTGDWEKKKLGSIFEEYSEKNHAELPPLMIVQGGGTILRDESDRSLQYDRSNLSSYKMVNKDDFIVHLRSFEGGLEKASSQGIISPAYHTFHGEGIDARFYYAYFRSAVFIRHDLKPHVYGIRDGRSIDIEGMKSILIPYTSYEEQKKIGDCISLLDQLIMLCQRKLEKLQSLKHAMLSEMFI